MGRLHAMEMAEMLDLDRALGWHLSSNHYPPVDPRWVPHAKQVVLEAAELIASVATYDEWREWAEQPCHSKTNGEVYESLHLESFAEAEAARLSREWNEED